MRINNNNFQRNANISRVAQAVWRKPGISRIEISRELDLYRSTVSNIISILIDNGVVIESEEGVSLPQGGRKPIYLNLNNNFGCVVGLELQPSRYKAVVINVCGEVLFRREGPAIRGEFMEVFDAVMAEIIPDIKQLGVPVLGICTGLPGIIDANSGRVITSDPFHLMNFDFMQNLDFRYGVPVMVENDANCCAWLQLTLNREQNLSDFISLMAEYHESRGEIRSGMGVGLALALEGRVRSGKHYAVGEFVSISWRPGMAGQTGLSDRVMNDLVRNDESYQLWLTDLFMSLVPVISMLDPDVLYIHGDPVHRKELVLKVLSEQVPQMLTVMGKIGCRLQFASDDSFGVAQGAAAMLLQKLFSVPDLSDIGTVSQLDWDSVFEIAGRNSSKTGNLTF